MLLPWTALGSGMRLRLAPVLQPFLYTAKRNLFSGRFSDFEKRFNSPAVEEPKNRQNLAAN